MQLSMVAQFRENYAISCTVRFIEASAYHPLRISGIRKAHIACIPFIRYCENGKQMFDATKRGKSDEIKNRRLL